MRSRPVTEIPNGIGSLSHRDTSIFDDLESEVRSYCRSVPSIFSRAVGAEMFDQRGNRYIDFISCAGSLNYGHNHPALKKAVMDWIDNDGIAQSLDFHTVPKRQFLEKFSQVILQPRGLDYRVQFTGPTGTNAIEAALKLARIVTGRNVIATFTGGYHGMTLGSLSVSASCTARLNNFGHGFLGGSCFLPYDGYLGPSLDTLPIIGKILDDPNSGISLPAAVLIETVQGEGGLNVASTKWLRALASMLKDRGILLIVDDIQAGCGRTGPFFSFERASIVLDMVCLSKSISGFGLPMALLLINPDYDKWEPAEHNGTFRGNSLAFVGASSALEFWKNNEIEKDISRNTNRLLEFLSEISSAHSNSCQLKGLGLYRGLSFKDPEAASKVSMACAERGVITETCGPYGRVVKIMPPLNIPDHILDTGMNVIFDSVNQICR